MANEVAVTTVDRYTALLAVLDAAAELEAHCCDDALPEKPSQEAVDRALELEAALCDAARALVKEEDTLRALLATTRAHATDTVH